jgi:fructooligosaccharide transport system substrate-binding protein
MFRLKSTVFTFLVLLMLILTAVACSSTDETSSDGKVEITYWRHDYEPEVKSLEKLIESFEKEHPNINVKMELIPGGDYETKIRTALAGGTPPDVMGLDGPTLAAYAAQGAVIPLDDYMNNNGNKDDILAPVIESLTYEGKIYAAPLNDASIAMFYNKKMFEEKGIPLPSKNPAEAWTWEQVLDAAKKLNDPDNGVYGWDLGWGFAPGEGSTFAKTPFLWQAGAEILSEDGKTVTLDSPETRKALNFFDTVYNEFKVGTKELPPDAFQTGKLAIMSTGPWGIAYIEDKYPDFKIGEDWDIAPLWKGDKQVTPNGSWNMAITAKSKHPEEAWKFINWVTGVEGAKVWYEDTKNLPARLSTVEAFPELQEYPLNIFVEQSSKYAKPRPVTPAYPAISEAISQMFADVAVADRDIDDVIKETVDAIQEGLDRVKD